jgi:cyclopropane-fatty-acyl-phospholipid synthase
MLDSATKGSDLNLIGMEDITRHYARTLHLWRARFRANIDRVRQLGADDAFLRLWDYYLSYCQAGFAERYSGCVQLVMAKPDARPEPLLPPWRGVK